MTGTLLSEASIWDFVSHLTDSISLDIPPKAHQWVIQRWGRG